MSTTTPRQPRPEDEQMPDDDEKRGNVSWGQAMATVGLALAIPSMIAAPALLGWWLDKHFGTSPLWLLISLGLGLFAAAMDIYKLLKKFGQLK